jgi:exonuclease SbcC
LRVERLSLKGITRFSEALTLDLRSLPPGLVAIVGPNGEGKTTILESPIAATHRAFPSRDKDLLAYATERDSYVETEFALDGRGAYRARVNIDATKRATDAVLVHLDTGQVLNDGRVSTFEKAIDELLPPMDLLLASAFSAQNRAGNFLTLKPKEAKGLWIKLLGIERYERMATTARSAVGFIEQTRSRLVAVRDRLARETDTSILDQLDRRSKQLQKEGGDAEVFVAEVDQKIAVLEARLAMVSDQSAAYQAASLRVHTLRTVLDGLLKDLRAHALKISGNDLSLQDDLTDIGASFAQQRKDVSERLKNNRDVLAKSDAIRLAQQQIKASDNALATVRAARSQADKEWSLQADTHRQVERRLAELRVVESQHDQAQSATALLGRVPFGEKCAAAGCQFVESAKVAMVELPKLRQQLDAQRALTIERDVLAGTMRGLRKVIDGADERIANLERERAVAEKQAAGADRLGVAEGRIAELETQLQALDPSEAVRRAEANARHASRATELQAQLADMIVTRDRARADLDAAEVDLAATAEGNQEAARIQADLSVRRRDRDTALQTIASAKSEASQLQFRREDLRQKREECGALDETIRTLDTELLEWQVLAKAFGRDGLATLEIDGAGPTVSNYTNSLLEACDLRRFTVELVTQQARADGKGLKEDFSVRVYDNQRGGEPRDVGDLSGGEQVIVSEALMNAIACYVNQRSAQPIRTCWRDETTGALDPENATRYLSMLRKVQELGGFHHLLFITHNEAAAALADAQIRVGGGTATIVEPPYQEAA